MVYITFSLSDFYILFPTNQQRHFKCCHELAASVQAVPPTLLVVPGSRVPEQSSCAACCHASCPPPQEAGLARCSSCWHLLSPGTSMAHFTQVWAGFLPKPLTIKHALLILSPLPCLLPHVTLVTHLFHFSNANSGLRSLLSLLCSECGLTLSRDSVLIVVVERHCFLSSSTFITLFDSHSFSDLWM